MSEFGKDGSGSVQPFPQWHALMSSVYVYVIVYDDRGHFHPMIITTPRQLLLYPMHVFLFYFLEIFYPRVQNMETDLFSFPEIFTTAIQISVVGNNYSQRE